MLVIWVEELILVGNLSRDSVLSTSGFGRERIFPEARNLLNMARSTDLHGASNLTQLVKEISVVDLWALGTWYLSLLDSL